MPPKKTSTTPGPSASIKGNLKPSLKPAAVAPAPGARRVPTQPQARTKKVDAEALKEAEAKIKEEQIREADRLQDLAEWENLNRRSWRGLGLTDPIKNVEVINIFYIENTTQLILIYLPRTSGNFSQPF